MASPIELRQRHIDAVRERERVEDRELLEAALAQRPELDAAGVRVVDLPSADTATEVPSAARRAAYRRHLAEIVAEAAEHADVGSLSDEADHREHAELRAQDQRFAAQPGLQVACDALCMRCRGGCCERGGDDAYLSPLEARRWLDAHPEHTPDELLALYLHHQADEIIAGACINQTPTGCALPRDLRAEVCNRYFCEPLEAFIDAVGDGEPGVSLVVRRSHSAWNHFDAGFQRVEEVLWLEEGSVRVVE